MMKHKEAKQLYSKLIIFSLTFIFSYSYAQNVTLEQIIDDSESIVTGIVKHVECKMEEDNDNIWTYVTIECKEYLKGDKLDEVVVRIPGGEVGEIGQYVSGTPKFNLNEEVLTFLSQDSKGKYYVNGWEEGKYTFIDGNWVKREIVYPDEFLTTVRNTIEEQSK